MNYNIYYNRSTGEKVQTIVKANALPSYQEVICFQQLYGEYGFFVLSKEQFMAEYTKKFPGVAGKEPIPIEKRADLPDKARRLTMKEDSVTAMDEEELAEDDELAEVDELPDMDTEGANPILMAFLDADSYKEKMDILEKHQEEMDEHLLNNIAVCLDVCLEDGVDGYEFIMEHLAMRKKYEQDRLR